LLESEGFFVFRKRKLYKMDVEKKALNDILNQLKSKACLKQKAFKNMMDVFASLKQEAEALSVKLNEKIQEIDKSVVVKLSEKNEFEFQVKVGSDVLIFTLTTNIVTFKNEYAVMQSEYVQEKEERKYFGQILVYNFMADSLKYDRLDDPGYLIARVLINHENHFYVEGVDQLNFLFSDISNNIISKEWLRLVIEKCISAAIDMDLIGANYPDIKITTLQQKMKDERPMGEGQKLGFQMKSMGQIKG